jgi:predicted SAM-dependent methyltransferase
MKKIQITVDQPSIAGYIYASPKNEELKVDFTDLKQFVNEYEADEIYGPEILDALDLENVNKYIREWSLLLKTNGILTVGGTDLYLLSKYAIQRTNDLPTINELLFKRMYFIRSICSVEYIRALLESIGMYILNISVDYSTSSYVIESQKRVV